MNNIEKINIGGIAFNIDCGAYHILEEYLHEIETFYKDELDSREIMDGIESRIAELFAERCGSDGIVIPVDVERIIRVIGRPSQMQEDAGMSDGGGGSDAKDTSKTRAPKRLFRNPENKVLAGVCSGLAIYFNADPVPVRLLFTILTIATMFCNIPWFFPLAYVILWIVMPCAKTVEEKWAMKGEKISFDGIAESVRNAAYDIEEAAQKVSKSDFGPVMKRVFGSFTGFILMAVGIAGTVCGLVAIVGYISPIDPLWISRLPFNPHLLYAIDLMNVWWVKICVLIIWFVPFISMLYTGVRLIFNIPKPSWRPGLILFLIWLAAIIAICTYIGVTALQTGNFEYRYRT